VPFYNAQDIELFQCQLLSSNVFNMFISWRGKRCFKHQDPSLCHSASYLISRGGSNRGYRSQGLKLTHLNPCTSIARFENEWSYTPLHMSSWSGSSLSTFTFTHSLQGPLQETFLISMSPCQKTYFNWHALHQTVKFSRV
jgi:hypothetical protein